MRQLSCVGSLNLVCQLGEDPEMLFDLEKDPNELNNLALQSAYSDILLRMRKQVDKQWNKSELTANVFASQEKRLLSRKQ